MLKVVIKKLATEMLKSSVPKKVYDDCAEMINKAFKIDEERIDNHKKNMKRLSKNKIMNASQTFNDGFFSPLSKNPIRNSF